MKDIKEVLFEIGYTNLREDGQFWRTKPLYRQSSNPTSLRIAKDTGSFKDFSADIGGNLEYLISITLGIPVNEAKSYTGNVTKVEKPVEYKDQVNFQSEVREWKSLTLVPNFNFYQNRGISKETQELFETRLCLSGKFNRRQVFAIKDKDGKVIGITGRAVMENPLKWKKIGQTANWIYPLFTEQYIKESRQLILVESIGDAMALWEAGVKNFLVLFGVKLSPKVKAAIVKMNPKEIIIATNNDVNGSGAGNKAAEKIKGELEMFFSEENIKICLPKKNDFGSQDLGENIEWAAINL